MMMMMMMMNRCLHTDSCLLFCLEWFPSCAEGKGEGSFSSFTLAGRDLTRITADALCAIQWKHLQIATANIAFILQKKTLMKKRLQSCFWRSLASGLLEAACCSSVAQNEPSLEEELILHQDGKFALFIPFVLSSIMYSRQEGNYKFLGISSKNCVAVMVICVISQPV